MTWEQRLRGWQAVGVERGYDGCLLDELGDADAIGWSISAIDSISVPALFAVRRPAHIRQIGALMFPCTT